MLGKPAAGSKHYEAVQRRDRCQLFLLRHGLLAQQCHVRRQRDQRPALSKDALVRSGARLEGARLDERPAQQGGVADQVAQGAGCVGPRLLLLVLQQRHQRPAAVPQALIQLSVVEACRDDSDSTEES